jgi:hypothetical protein
MFIWQKRSPTHALFEELCQFQKFEQDFPVAERTAALQANKPLVKKLMDKDPSFNK